MAQTSEVTLRVWDDDLIPDEITKLLGAQPSATQIKGQKFVARKTGRVRYAKTGMWMLNASHREPEDLDGQIQEIFSQTTNDLAVWRSIGEKYQLDLSCGLFLVGSSGRMGLSAQSLASLGERGIEIGLDIYAGDDEDEAGT